MIDAFFEQRFSNSPPPSKKDAVRLAHRLGVAAIQYKWLTDAYGTTEGDEETGIFWITLRPNMRPEQEMVTMLHELRHVAAGLGLCSDSEEACNKYAACLLTNGVAGMNEKHEWERERHLDWVSYEFTACNGVGYG